MLEESEIMFMELGQIYKIGDITVSMFLHQTDARAVVLLNQGNASIEIPMPILFEIMERFVKKTNEDGEEEYGKN
jgi:hypothetical protein